MMIEPTLKLNAFAHWMHKAIFLVWKPCYKDNMNPKLTSQSKMTDRMYWYDVVMKTTLWLFVSFLCFFPTHFVNRQRTQKGRFSKYAQTCWLGLCRGSHSPFFHRSCTHGPGIPLSLATAPKQRATIAPAFHRSCTHVHIMHLLLHHQPILMIFWKATGANR